MRDKDGKDDDYNIDKALEEATFINQGDLWQIGKHIMLCGDTTNLDNLNHLMYDKKANLIVTDLPYNVNFGSASGLKIKNINKIARISIKSCYPVLF